MQETMAALNLLAKLLYPQVVHALVQPVLALLSHKESVIRKKAVQVAYKIFKIQNALIPDFDERLRRALCDQHPSTF
jgi:vesicle coat complex subunit